MRIYLDNCCYNRPYDDQSQLQISLEAQAKLFVQDAIRNGKLELTASYMSIYENNQNPFKSKRDNIYLFLQHHVSFFVGFEHEDQISIIRNEAMKTGIKAKDATHIACAIFSGCDYLLTTDKRLLKYQSEKIKIINPVDFIGQLEE